MFSTLVLFLYLFHQNKFICNDNIYVLNRFLVIIRLSYYLIYFTQIEHNLKNIINPLSVLSTGMVSYSNKIFIKHTKTISCTGRIGLYKMTSNPIKLKANMDLKRLLKSLQYRPCRSKSRTIWINVSVNISQI